MQQEVHGSRKSPADTAGPESITQRKGAFIKAAHQYGQLYEWRKARDQRFTEKEFRLATGDLLRASVKGGEKMYRLGGSTGVFGLS